MMRGARPSDGSSSSSSFGLAISARPMASICCSPPESSAPRWELRSSRTREQLVDARPGPAPWRALSLLPMPPARRFSSTVSRPKMRRPSGTCDQAHPHGLRRVREPRSVSSKRGAGVDASAVQPQGAGDRAQQRGLAGAVAAEDGDDLAVRDLHRHPAHRLNGAAVGHVERVDAQHGQHFLSAPSPARERGGSS